MEDRTAQFKAWMKEETTKLRNWQITFMFFPPFMIYAIIGTVKKTQSTFMGKCFRCGWTKSNNNVF